MRHLTIVALLLLFGNSLFGQKTNDQFEIIPYFRCDWYPKFNYSINSVNTNAVKIIGKSFGINGSYKIAINNKIHLKAGLGYYKYAFNKIIQTNSLFGKSDTRVIEDYTPPGNTTPSLVFSTSKYWYNSIAINIGLERHIEIRKNMKIVFGADLTNCFTFSQNYFITYPSPNGDDYKLTESRYFGFSTKGHIGLQKTFNRLSIGPTIILPIYDSWKQDDVFPLEDNSKSRSKWLTGIGIGISCNYSLIKKRRDEK